jgi:hypothetical protein
MKERIMKQIYSYVEVAGKSFIPPEIIGDRASLPTYLMSINGRHYISVEGRIPRQPPEIKVEGPINLRAAENQDLAVMLADQSEPTGEVRNARSREYPDLRDQIGAIMAEFQKRQDAGERLTPELSDLLAKITETKNKNPKKNADLGL